MMDPRHKDLLRRLRLELCSEGLADGLLPHYLFQEGIITKDQLDVIDNQMTSKDKSMKLLDILPTRGPNAFRVFLESLNEFPWVKEKLELQCMGVEDHPTEINLYVQPSVLNKCPSDKQLSLLAGRLGPEWEQILVLLGLDLNELYKCKIHNPYNVTSQVMEGLVNWKRRMGCKATIQCLIDALQEAEVDPSVMQLFAL
ncbi:death domain-containing protein CRADD-like [Discoglossus pictus]